MTYPRPLRPGFRDVRCSGFERSVHGEAPLDDLFQLEVETLNATAWRSAVRRLERTSAQVVLVQETRVLARDVPRLSAQAQRRGWQTLWSPAIPGKRGKASGGVAICAKMPVSLAAPPRGPSDVVKGRVVAGMVEAPGCRPTVVYSGYLRDGVGANAENLGYLAKVGAHCKLQPDGVQAIVGADFNMNPQALDDTDFPTEVGGAIVNPGGGATTCRTAKAANLLDFFVVSKGMAKGIESVRVIERSGIKTHSPVVLRFHARLTSLKALALRKPPPLGSEPLVGPRPPPPDWRPLTTKLRELSSRAARGGRKAIEVDYQRAFEQWADLAERELHGATGEPEVKLGLRGRAPRLFWRSILPEKVSPRSSDAVVAIRALASLIDDLKRITRSENDEGTTVDARKKVDLEAVRREVAEVRNMPGAADAVHLADEALRLIRDFGSDGLQCGREGEPAVPHAHASPVDAPAAMARDSHPSRREGAVVVGTAVGQAAGGRSTPQAASRRDDAFDLEEDPLAELNDADPDVDGPEELDDQPPGLYYDDSDDDDAVDVEGDREEIEAVTTETQQTWPSRLQELDGKIA